MKRVASAPRHDLAAKASASGFTPLAEGQAYWREDAYYAFSLPEIEDVFETAVADLHALCLELVARAVDNERTMERLRLAPRLRDLARASWKAGDPSLYGRFDLTVGADGRTKMLEFNADTPTSLYESAVFQWGWLEDLKASGALAPDADQFNSIHDKLVAAWPEVAGGRPVHFCAMDAAEDIGTVDYLAETARAAGCEVRAPTTMREIALRRGGRGERFVDPLRREIDVMFKLYPWEWMAQDPFAASAAMARTRFVEPPWKAILSTKAILPLLWEMAPGHPNLLPARFEDEADGADVGRDLVRKPLRSREGDGVTIVANGRVAAATPAGTSDRNGAVLQTLCPLPDFDGRRPVVGAWVVAGQPAGIGIREDAGAITTNRSRFVPHAIV